MPLHSPSTPRSRMPEHTDTQTTATIDMSVSFVRMVPLILGFGVETFIVALRAPHDITFDGGKFGVLFGANTGVVEIFNSCGPTAPRPTVRGISLVSSPLRLPGF